MTVDKDDLKGIEAIDWNTVPAIDSGVVKDCRYKVGEYELRLLKNPATTGSDELIDIVYSMVLLSGKDILLYGNIERDNLRALAASLGVSTKELQAEYKTHTYFGPLRTVMYTAEAKEEQEVYEGNLADNDVALYLADFILDAIDCLDEMEVITD